LACRARITPPVPRARSEARGRPSRRCAPGARDGADAYSSAQEADCAAKQSVYYDAARRALYLAGSASRQAELDELRASERAAQERAKELEDDLTQMRDLLSPDWQNQTELGGQVMLALKKARDEANQAEERTTTAEARVAELQARLLPGCER
jgi:gas vesicle protein